TVGVVGLLLAAGALWVFYKIAGEVLAKETQAIDIQVLLTIQQWHRPWLDQVMIWLTALGQPSVLLVSSLVLVVLLLRRKKAPEAVALVIVALGGLGLNLLLKKLFARDHPALWERTVHVDFYSFPSGHAMMSMILYGAIGYLLATQFPQWRGWIAVVIVGLVGAIGFTRLYLGVHWLTDVAAGYAAGLVWLLVVRVGLEVWKQRRQAAVNSSKELPKS
ncbi:MAG TPA: phosphatase PAP2 family protein, partial [Thermosynechococcaceae cyanobacterium]